MANTTWLFWGMGTGLALAGLWLVYRAMWRDRSRGRRRCPHCWYEMAGVLGLVCPECGRDARSERRLLRTRRRWGRALIGVVLTMVGAVSAAVPTVKQKGALAVMPARLLIALAPRAGQEWRWDPVKRIGKTNVFVEELLRREKTGALSAGAWGATVRHEGVIVTRRRWPANTPVVVSMTPPRWAGLREIELSPRFKGAMSAKCGTLFRETCGNASMGRRESEQHQSIGMLPEGSDGFSADVCVLENKNGDGFSWPRRTRPAWRGTVRVPIKIVASVDEAIAPVKSTAMDAAVRKALQVRAIISDNNWGGDTGGVRLELARGAHSELQGVAFGVIVEVLMDGKVVGSQAGRMEEPEFYFGSAPGAVQFFAWVPALNDKRSLVDEPMELARWAIRVRGDGVQSLCDWECDRYWAGEITFPLRDVLDIMPPRARGG